MIQRKLNKYLLTALFIFACSLPASVFAQNSMGALSIGMGQTGVAVHSDWSAFNNVALLQTEQNSVSFYGFRYVGIAEITDMAATSTFQTSRGTIAGSIHRYGFNLFSENRFLLGYKNELGRFHYGASVSYTYINQGGNYGSASAIGFDLGLAAEITELLLFGARATNLNQPSYGDTDEELPRELAAGLSYYLTPDALVTAEIVKDVLFPTSFRTGVQYEVIESLFLRAGFTTKPETYSFGFGYQSSRWDVNFALQQHNPLGLSPALDLAVKF